MQEGHLGGSLRDLCGSVEGAPLWWGLPEFDTSGRDFRVLRMRDPLKSMV